MLVAEVSVSVENYTQEIKDGYHVNANWFARYRTKKAKIKHLYILSTEAEGRPFSGEVEGPEACLIISM